MSLVWREMEFVSQLQMEIGDCFLSSALNARQRIREAALVIREQTVPSRRSTDACNRRHKLATDEKDNKKTTGRKRITLRAFRVLAIIL